MSKRCEGQGSRTTSWAYDHQTATEGRRIRSEVFTTKRLAGGEGENQAPASQNTVVLVIAADDGERGPPVVANNEQRAVRQPSGKW
jgi:hypothetical protein